VLGIDDYELAAIFTVQTAGEALNHHPHLHGLLADGYWKGDVFTRFPEIDIAALTKAFAERVLAALHKQELITDDVVAQVLSQEHTGCSVWMSQPFHDDDSERFVARYIERAPLSLEKLSIQDDIVIYTTKEGVTHEFDVLEFLALLSCQVPAPYESLTRYFGRYSCRRRGERAKKLSPPPTEEQDSDYRQDFGELSRVEFRKSSWTACIKRVYEIDPLQCPPSARAQVEGKCKSQMRIIAFIQDEHSIKDIMRVQGIPDFQAPPPIPKFIDTREALDELPS
jgi:hypothetical protein